MSNCLGLITAPAPWTDDEAWRRISYNPNDNHSTADLDVDVAAGPLETESATMNEPDSLIIWVEASALTTLQPEQLIGMGIRGRWGLFGRAGAEEEPYSKWWCVELKDCTSFLSAGPEP